MYIMMPKGSFWTTLKDTSGSWFNFLVLFENLGSQWSGRKNTKKVEEIKRAISTWDCHWTPKGSFLKIQKLTIKLYAKKNKGLVTLKKKSSHNPITTSMNGYFNVHNEFLQTNLVSYCVLEIFNEYLFIYFHLFSFILF